MHSGDFLESRTRGSAVNARCDEPGVRGTPAGLGEGPLLQRHRQSQLIEDEGTRRYGCSQPPPRRAEVGGANKKFRRRTKKSERARVLERHASFNNCDFCNFIKLKNTEDSCHICKEENANVNPNNVNEKSNNNVTVNENNEKSNVNDDFIDKNDKVNKSNQNSRVSNLIPRDEGVVNDKSSKK